MQPSNDVSKERPCACGCGEGAGFYKATNTRDGALKGAPKKFKSGHQHRAATAPWELTHLRERERFWSLVDNTDDCWLWTGGNAHFGYGKFYLSPTEPGAKSKSVRAHRYAYETEVGPIPEGLFLLHSCDVPACVNPSHLRPGTQIENVADAIERGRFTNGNKRKTHCPKGHPYDDQNTYVDKRGKRSCRACGNERRARYRRPAPCTEGDGSADQ